MQNVSPDSNLFVVDNDKYTVQNTVVKNETSFLRTDKHHLCSFPQDRTEMYDTMVDSKETVTLTWKNVNVMVTPKSGACCNGSDQNTLPKHVLRNVYGIAKPGKLLAIIGASGSGKSTLLNVLTSRNQTNALMTTSDVRANGVDVKGGIRNISAYVTQDDMFITTMTVREHLRFRALLRMEKKVSQSRRYERVEELIKETGLTKCADNMIGNIGRVKGLSGGERRRLSFASEFLANPPLLFCDEPTSGLDSFMAENIVQILKSMADRGKTVLCTIHQPSSEMFASFDNILLMAEGRIAFTGTANDALKFYTSIGYPCPMNFNPADFYILAMAVIPGNEKECKTRIESVCESFHSSKLFKDFEAEVEYTYQNPKKGGILYKEAFSSTSRYEAALYQQFVLLLTRSWRTAIREPMVIRIRFAQTIMLAMFLGLIFFQLDLSQEGVMNINGVLYLVLTNLSFTQVFAVLNTFPLETPIFFREYRIGLYRVDIYFITKALAELLSFIVIPFAFCCITYWMVGLYASIEAFFTFAGAILLVSNVAVSFGYIVSAAANSVTNALAIASPIINTLLMFGGFFMNSRSTPVYFIWLEYLSWFKYANELIVVNQWRRVNKIRCPTGSNGTYVDECLFTSGSAVIKYFGFDESHIWLDFGLLLTMLIVYRVIAFIILLVKVKRSRK